ncbi:uncharacterized protein PV06_03012 [Exophiala oligosperma]|uniref:Uncharacterized protein n=1 Tax=Exophiala oligosperma TaxID=215243 RepID=A0A0D2C479_9EURO|nr:uncharacterized protein PV06_03012 [Exophiala oligosperma]KIW44552.1 hypothetical protein PV06_03012 [Exophiala oligosperma]
MSPAQPPEDLLKRLVEDLVFLFEELLPVVQTQIDNEKALGERVQFAANEYERLLAAGSSSSIPSVSPSDVAKRLRQPLTASRLPQAWKIQKTQEAIQYYRMLHTKEPPRSGALKCPIAHHATDPEDLERDFTTPGVQGNLGCPFAKMSNGISHPLNLEEDPIAAEFHQDENSTRSPNDQRPGQCPIRFLDQHSPEEVAKYFENHKHEIPRSHEICVRRYQANETSARQLDAKYGSLVNMIQGLGVKHKAYLPERDRIEERDKASSNNVEKWAETVSNDAAPVTMDTSAADEERRVSHFERPLREVRVGESPSRPWGISVPANKEVPPSALQSEDGVAHLKIDPEDSRASPPTKPSRCPVDHGQAQQAERPAPKSEPDLVKDPDSRTQIIFNGPVFFGYSADQVAALLQQTNLGGARPAEGQ